MRSPDFGQEFIRQLQFICRQSPIRHDDALLNAAEPAHRGSLTTSQRTKSAAGEKARTVAYISPANYILVSQVAAN